MIKKLLRSIRQKPTAVREQYAFWIACTLTGVITLVWFTTTAGLAGQSDPVVQVEDTNQAPDSLSNFLDETQTLIQTIPEELESVLSITQSPEPSLANATATTNNVQAAAVIAAPTVNARQEVRIATTSAAADDQ